MTADLGPWAPLRPAELALLMSAVRAPWWLAGGWALDYFLGRVTREHADTDALILRRDHMDVRESLSLDPP